MQESIFTINFSTKASRYICSGGSGQVVRIWDLQRRRCIKWLKGHTDTITDVKYNCRDEHLASISLCGDLIIHNLSSGARATELKDPNGQVCLLVQLLFITKPLRILVLIGVCNLYTFVSDVLDVCMMVQAQVLRVLDYSRISRHLLVTAGDDGSVHLWDTTGRNPKVHLMKLLYWENFSPLVDLALHVNLL